MTTEHVIKTIATSMGLKYSLGTLYQLNQALDKIVRKKEYPVCLQVQTTDGSYSFEETPYYRRIHESQSIRLVFGDAIKFDYEPERILSQVENLKAQGVELLQWLNRTDLFQPIANITYSVMYDRFDANLVAVLFEFSLQEKQGVCVKDMEPGAFSEAFNKSYNGQA